MSTQSTLPSVEQSFDNVKPQYDTQLPLFTDSMIHHKVSRPRNKKIVYSNSGDMGKTYGVSSSRRVLTPQLLLKRFDQVRDCLTDTLDLTIGQREATLRMLTYWAYYGKVYPKAAQVAADPGCSKATFWRTVRLLADLGLLSVINRYIVRPHAQISNLYRLDRLLLVIARYLAEHGVPFLEKWLKPYLTMPGHQFWPGLLGGQGSFLHDTS